MSDYSVSPSGEKFVLPEKGEYAAEFARVDRVTRQRASAMGLDWWKTHQLLVR